MKMMEYDLMERCKKLREALVNGNEERASQLLYEWTKTGKADLGDFRELLAVFTEDVYDRGAED